MFVMGPPILVRKHLYIQTPPSSQLIVSCHDISVDVSVFHNTISMAMDQ